MCGIAGIVGETDSNSAHQMARVMITTMRHRGPDDARVWSELGAGIACARLALIGGTPRASQCPRRTAAGWWRTRT